MAVHPKLTGRLQRLGLRHAPHRDQSPFHRSQLGPSTLQAAAGVLAAVVVLLWTAWLLTDILVRIVY